MEFYLASFGTHNPFTSLMLPEHAIYPISKDSRNGLDLDYTSLLLGNKYYIDEEAFNYILDERKTFLLPMAGTLRFLFKEGYLELINTKAIVQANESAIKEKVELLSQNTDVWLRIIRAQWRGVKEDYVDFHLKYGSPDKSALNTGLYPVLNYLHQIGENDNHDKYREIVSLIESRRKNLSVIDKKYITEISKPLLSQIIINELIQKKAACPVLDWEDNDAYYRQFSFYSWDNETTLERNIFSNSRKIFEYITPDLLPQSIEDVVKFINKRGAVSSLRKQIITDIQNGVEVNEEWYRKFINEVFAQDFSTKKKMKIFKWVGAFAGLFIPGSTIVADAAKEIGQTVTEDTVENLVASDRFIWYYTLQKNLKRAK